MGDNETKETETVNGLKIETNTDPGLNSAGSGNGTPKSNASSLDNIETSSIVRKTDAWKEPAHGKAELNVFKDLM